MHVSLPEGNMLLSVRLFCFRELCRLFYIQFFYHCVHVFLIVTQLEVFFKHRIFYFQYIIVLPGDIACALSVLIIQKTFASKLLRLCTNNNKKQDYLSRLSGGKWFKCQKTQLAQRTPRMARSLSYIASLSLVIRCSYGSRAWSCNRHFLKEVGYLDQRIVCRNTCLF